LEENDMYKTVLSKVTARQELTESDIFELIAAINNDEVSDIQIAGFQVALLMKGASQRETAYIAKAMRKNCVRIKPSVEKELMDTCGTGGGSALSTFRQPSPSSPPRLAYRWQNTEAVR
jgi:anthranilate phosphoribosyltransferase